MKIYLLERDAKNYRWMEYKGNWFEFFWKLLDSEPLGKFEKKIKWKTIREPKEIRMSDYPVFSVPAISQKAYDVLSDSFLGLAEILIVSSLVRNFVPEKSRKSIMLRQTESPFEVLLNRHSYSNAQSASHLNTQADSLLSVLYKNPLRGKCRQQRSAFEFHG